MYFLRFFTKLCSRYDDKIMLKLFDNAKVFIPLKNLPTVAIFIMMKQKMVNILKELGL